MSDLENVGNIFKWNEPNEAQMAQLNVILTAASAYYALIVTTVPSGEARSQSIDRLIEATFWASKGIINPPIPR